MKLLTRKEVLERLRISETTLSRFIQIGTMPIPFTITGSRPQLWLESEIDEILKSCVCSKHSYYRDISEHYDVMRAAVEKIHKKRKYKKEL